MIRKQIYITPEDDARLKRLARERGCAEAEVVREALRQVSPAETEGAIARLRKAGLLMKSPQRTPVDQKELVAREARLRKLLGGDVRLTQAVMEERDDYYADPYR